MAKLIFDNGMTFEGTVEELSELMQKVGGSGAEIAEDGELKIGDYVVPLKSADDVYGITNTEMKLGKVVEGEVDCYGDIRIEVVAHENDIEVGESYSVESKYFRKATDEEIAKAKADAKWTKLGRKPGEFKVGDIFRAPGRSAGGLHEIIEIRERDDHPIRFINRAGDNDGYMKDAPIELVCPVENRVDIDTGGEADTE